MAFLTSIIICTRNRAASLAETLASIGRCMVPEDMKAELLVVDNGSTDRTRAVVEAAMFGNMMLRYVYEERCGKGYAYNLGLAEARGEVLLFTDDDVRVPADWIEGMCRPVVTGMADGVRGQVMPAPELGARLKGWGGMFATVSKDDVGEMLLIGANMSFGRHVLEKVPQFDVELGPGALGFGDETLFSRQLIAAGYKLVRGEGAAVVHHFEASRIARASFVKTVDRMARSSAYIEYHWEHAAVPAGIPALLERLKRGLRLRRALFFWDWFRRDLCPGWEKEKVEWIGRHEQLLIESRRPRMYEKHGLVKLDGAAEQATAGVVR